MAERVLFCHFSSLKKPHFICPCVPIGFTYRFGKYLNQQPNEQPVAPVMKWKEQVIDNLT